MVVGSDGDADQVALDMGKIDRICGDLGARDLGAEPGEHWWKHRYVSTSLPLLPTCCRKWPSTFETTTTYDRIYELYLAKKRAIEEDFKDWGPTTSPTFPLVQVGVMIYDRFIIEKPPQDPHEALQLHTEVWAKAARTSLAAGGVLNDHHGVGFKLGWLMRNFTEPHGRPARALRMPSIPRGS
ncbi:MAG: hypothetical protein MZV70_12585 [Desulfobacterales bacterium]|nr:hypothetical protein [Desulfobacterales bacterium]